MAGKFFLEKKSIDRALILLRDVVAALENAGVRYSLDGGTALGVIREGRLLPWDTDIDLAVDSSDLPRLKYAAIILFFKGYRIRFRRAEVQAGPLALGDVRVVKIWKRRFFFLRGEMIDIFLRYSENENCYWLLGGKDRMSLCKMPARFHNELSSIQFNGRNYIIPRDWDEFLTYRYGDWRIPVKAWDAFVNDGSITCATPETNLPAI